MYPKMLQERVVEKNNLKNKKYIKSFFSYVQNELNSSTTHGLCYILHPRLLLVERIFWVICFMASVTFMLYLLSVEYTRFINSPTVMIVEMNYFDWNISYPAITLCPVSKLNTTLYQHLLETTFHGTGLQSDAFFWGVASGGMNNIDFIYTDISENISSVLNPKDYAKLAATVFINFPENSLTINAHWDVAVRSAMTEMGMCHVINSNVAVYDNPFNWHGENQEYERTNVELTIYEGDFLAQITNYTDNFKVYIHHPDELILSNSPSFTFDKEGYVTFGLSVWSTRVSDEIRATSISLRKCRFVNEPLNKRYPVYSYNRCIIECRIGIILQLCGCVPHFYKPLPSERVCSIEELKCVLNYQHEIISLKIPTNIMKQFRYSKKLPKSPVDCGCLSECEKDVYQKDIEHFSFEKYLNKLQIGITSFPKTRYVRDIIFRTNDMLLKTGGVINLFIGSSILSIMELIGIVIKFLIYLTQVLWMKLKYCLIKRILTVFMGQ